MAELDSELVQRFKDYKKFERGQALRGVGALPAGLQAMRSGGSAAASAAMEGVFDRGQATAQDTPLDYAKLKLQAVKLLTDAKMDAAKLKASAADGPRGKSSKLAAFEKALDAATQLVGEQGRSSVAMASAKLREKMGAMTTARVKMLEPKSSLDPGIIDSAVKLSDSVTVGDGSLMNPGYWDAVAKLVNQTNGDPAARAALYSTLTSRSGITPAEWYDKMREAANDGAVGASALLDGYDAVQAQVAEMHDIQTAFAEKYEDDALKAINATMGGTPGADAVVKATKMYLDIYNGEGDDINVEKAGEEIVGALAGLDPAKDAQQKKAFDDLLNQTDKPPDQLPTHLREARQRIMEDESFKKFMIDNGLPDPDAAFRELRRRSNEQIYANRVASKQSVQAQKESEKVTPVQAQMPKNEDLDGLAGEMGIKPAPLPTPDNKNSSGVVAEKAWHAVSTPTRSVPNAVNLIRDQFGKRRDKVLFDRNEAARKSAAELKSASEGKLSEEERRKLQEQALGKPLSEEEWRKLLDVTTAGDKTAFTPNSQGGTQLG